MVLDKFRHERRNAFVRRRHFLEFAARENDRYDLAHPCGRAREAAPFRLGAYFVARELAYREVARRGFAARFGRGFRLLVLHYALHVGGPELAERLAHREEGGEMNAVALDSRADVARRDGEVAVHFEIRQIRDGGEIEFFRDLRADLRRVAVDGLPAAEDHVGLEGGDGLGENVARRERVGARRLAVGDENRLFGAARERLAEDGRRRGEPHRDHRHFAAVALLDGERRLEGVLVLGVEDRGQRRAVDGAVGLHGLAGHLLGVRNLLDADYARVSIHGLSIIPNSGPELCPKGQLPAAAEFRRE